MEVVLQSQSQFVCGLYYFTMGTGRSSSQFNDGREGAGLNV